MKNILFISPHPDDETLGCGGSILNFKKNGYKVHWLIITKMSKKFTQNQKKIRKKEIESVYKKYKFSSLTNFNFNSGDLNSLNYSSLLNKVKKLLSKTKFQNIFLPFINDIHTDHYFTAKAALASLKWFRYKSVEKIFYYESLSETNMFDNIKFLPNTFFDITDSIDSKISILKIYKSEFHEHPFPRSEESLRSLARLRGSESGFSYAESFMLIYDRSNSLK